MEKRILIIDDEENMRHMLTALLNESGFVVDAVADGALGLAKIEETHYNFIFCDIRMPKMDGMMFLKAAADKLENSYVIMMSAYGGIETAVESMKLAHTIIFQNRSRQMKYCSHFERRMNGNG